MKHWSSSFSSDLSHSSLNFCGYSDQVTGGPLQFGSGAFSLFVFVLRCMTFNVGLLRWKSSLLLQRSCARFPGEKINCRTKRRKNIMERKKSTVTVFPGIFRSLNIIWRTILVLIETVSFQMSLLLLEEIVT